MKTWLRNVLVVFVLLLSLAIVKPVHAQCAQCAATIASNQKNGGSAGNGLNHGILFLMTAPYLAVGLIGLLWYKKYRRKNINIDVPDNKLNLN